MFNHTDNADNLADNITDTLERTVRLADSTIRECGSQERISLSGLNMVRRVSLNLGDAIFLMRHLECEGTASKETLAAFRVLMTRMIEQRAQLAAIQSAKSRLH